MAKPGNWNRNPWNRGKARKPDTSPGLSPIMQQIVAERVFQDCTQAWLAERVGWSVTAIQQYESGSRKAPLAYAEAAANTLGMRLVLRKASGPLFGQTQEGED